MLICLWMALNFGDSPQTIHVGLIDLRLFGTKLKLEDGLSVLVLIVICFHLLLWYLKTSMLLISSRLMMMSNQRLDLNLPKLIASHYATKSKDKFGLDRFTIVIVSAVKKIKSLYSKWTTANLQSSGNALNNHFKT